MFLLSVGGEACDVRLSLKHGRSMKPELVCANSTLEAAKEDRYCGFYSTNQCTNFLDLTGPLVVGGLPPSKQAEATADERRLISTEIENPKPLDTLLTQINDHDTAIEFYLASRAAVDSARTLPL